MPEREGAPSVKGQAKDWPTVDPEVLRSWADCRTWEDLDYYIAARVSMIQLQIMWQRP